MAKLERVRNVLLWVLIISVLGIGIFTFNYLRTAGQFNLKERTFEGVGSSSEVTVNLGPAAPLPTHGRK